MRRARREQPKFSHSRAVERARLTPGRLRKSAICQGGQSDPLHPRGRRILRTPSGANWYHSLLLAIANRGLGGHAAQLRRRRVVSVRGHGRGHAAPCRGAAGACPPRRSRPSQPTAPPAAQRAGAPPVTFGRAGPCAGPASPASCVDSAAVPAASTSSTVARAPYGRTRLRGASSARIAARRRPGRGGGGPCLGRYGAPDAARSPPRCAGTGGRALRRYERRAESYDAIGANTRFEFPICPIAELDLPHPRYCRPRRVTPTVRAWFGGGAHLS